MNKTIIALTLIVLCSITSLHAKSGDEVRNGGGLAENYLIHALNNMKQNIKLCLAQTDCGQQNNGREILKNILNSLTNLNTSEMLKFTNDAQRPGLFNIDGYVRLAVTGNNVGDTIYYNLDLLYKNNQVSLNYGDAIQSLVHELGHQQKITNHDQLELLGSEVRKASSGAVNSAAYLPYLNNRGFAALGIENRSFTDDGSLTLLFKNDMINLTSLFTPLKNDCDQMNPTDPLVSNALQFFNLRWTPSLTTSAPSEKTLTGNVVLYCEHKYLKKYRRLYEFQVNVDVIYTDTFVYRNSRLLSKPKFVFLMGVSSIE